MKNLLYLNKFFWKYRGRLLMGFLLVIAGNVLTVYAPVLIGDGINFLADSLSASNEIKKGAASFSVSTPESLNWFSKFLGISNHHVELNSANFSSVVVRIAVILAIGYLLVYLIKGFFLFYQRQALIVMSRYIEYELKNEIYDQYQKLDMAFYKRNRTGDLMNRISEDVNRVRMYLGPAVMYTMNLVVLLVMCITVMLKIDSELTLYTLAPFPFMMIAIFYVSTVINKKTERTQRQQSKLSTMVQETISGIRVIKSFHREKFYTDDFRKESDVYKEKQLELVRVDALFMPVIMLLVGLSTILTVYVGANKVIAGEIGPGVIVQFVFYVTNLTWPFASVGWVTSLVQKAEASQERINEFLKATPEIKNETDTIEKIKGAIEFRNVSFTYPEDGALALQNISFKIAPGEVLGVVGRTGSGKSTLCNLVLRMFDPSSGSILIDGKDLKKHHLYNLRRSIGYVPQEVFLFSDTISHNVAFGEEQASEEKIIQACKDADIHNNIMDFPNQYNTLLGERGINLSGGQKQRVAIARAIIKNPDILVFDDCLSAVDTETEEHILQALKKIMKGKSSLIISHRISSVKNADRIIVLDRGKLIEEGTHEELVLHNGLYASLYNQQLSDSHSD
jgi:ATP-binding cassette, subfamily B, multidrug efflux pump